MKTRIRECGETAKLDLHCATMQPLFQVIIDEVGKYAQIIINFVKPRRMAGKLIKAISLIITVISRVYTIYTRDKVKI